MENYSINNELWPEDTLLFQSMKGNYASEEEKEFFEIMYEKLLHENAPCNELLVDPSTNTDNIYLFRIGDEEMEVGGGPLKGRLHTMTLAEVLKADLKEIGCLDRNISLLQWLRDANYAYLNYNNNEENQ